jgi:hypothetical protein
MLQVEATGIEEERRRGEEEETTLTSVTLLISCKLSFLTAGFKSYLHTRPLKSLKKIFVWYFGN